MWKKLLSSTNGSLGSADLFKLNDGNYLLAGGLTTSDGASNILLVKITPDGIILLSRTYGSSVPGENSFVGNIINNPDGSLIVSGQVMGFDMTTYTFTSSILAMKLKADLSIAWQKKLSGGMVNAVISKTGSGEILLSGFRAASLAGATNALYAKLNPTTFSPVWTKTFGGAGAEMGFLTKTDTNYMLSGYTESFGGATVNKPNIFGIILDANGNYANCNVKNFSLTVGDPGLAMSHITLTKTISFTLTARTPGSPSNITLTRKSPTLVEKNICPSIAAPQGEASEGPVDLQQEAEF